ncbi:uncharacterized protein LOC109601381 [Aethina tumida]|uniref:uncharacterized protein LOC109601381 n=1 Tax=Aethina tumida TaxID=116153 RepID=UPI00214912CA|nr:uncharacterized protein LOC109601381 [Aethina tumida]
MAEALEKPTHGEAMRKILESMSGLALDKPIDTVHEWYIPQWFDVTHWKIDKRYKLEVTNIYDPSKFWVVTKFEELAVFQKELKQFYDKRRKTLHFPLKEITKDRLCVIEKQGVYYRAMVRRTIITGGSEICIQAFLLDYGYVSHVPPNKMFRFYKGLTKLPMLAVRGELDQVRPKGSEWTTEEARRVSNMLSNANTLGTLKAIDTDRKVLSLDLEVYKTRKEFARHLAIDLVRQKLARKARPTVNRQAEYFFPLHQELELGLAPFPKFLLEKLKSNLSPPAGDKPTDKKKNITNL